MGVPSTRPPHTRSRARIGATGPTGIRTPPAAPPQGGSGRARHESAPPTACRLPTERSAHDAALRPTGPEHSSLSVKRAAEAVVVMGLSSGGRRLAGGTAVAPACQRFFTLPTRPWGFRRDSFRAGLQVAPRTRGSSSSRPEPACATRRGTPAGMAELADATDLKSVGRKAVGVRSSLPACTTKFPTGWQFSACRSVGTS